MMNKPQDSLCFTSFVGTGLWTFPIRTNGRVLTLPFPINNVLGFKVKAITWKTPPFDTEEDTLLWISCNSLQVLSRSGRFQWSPDEEYTLFGFKNNTIACYDVSLDSARTPKENQDYPSTFILEKGSTMINRIDFTLEANHSGFLSITEEQDVNITLEFYFSL